MNWQLIASASAALAVGALGFVLSAMDRGLDLTSLQRRRVRNFHRYSLVLCLVVALVVIWADELRVAAIIASAFAVAIVLANKELLMCMAGWWLKTSGGAYRIGDRIQVGDHRGDVLDYGILTTTLMEVGSSPMDSNLRSGRVITLPNSLLLSQPLINDTHSLSYAWCELTVDVAAGDPWAREESLLLEAAHEQVADYKDEVEKQCVATERRLAFHSIQADPRVFVEIQPSGVIELTLRVALPVRGLRAARDALMRNYLSKRG